MILSSRQKTTTKPPRHGPLSLYASGDHVSHPSDSTTRYSFHCLVESPLPSPGLPSPSFRPGKKLSSCRYRILRRLLLWVCGVCVILWFALSALNDEHPPSGMSYLSHDGKAYEIVGDDALPQLPSPVIVTDKRGRSKWTVSIPPGLDFPLQPEEYSNICAQSTDMAQHVSELKSHGSGHHHAGHQGYYHVDPNFMDVAEAESHGMLPGISDSQPHRALDALSGKDDGLDSMGEDLETMRNGKKKSVCHRSLTYVMQTSDAGFGKTLMGLWMAYGLAKKERRAFFVDDTDWAYGKYTTYFRPPPSPSCLPAPKTQILPCPHHARHLLVSAATTSWTFGHAFNEYFEDGHKTGVLRQEPIFSLLRQGYEALFELADDDAKYVNQRVEEINRAVHAKGGLTVGIHVRHGDRHPFEFQYQGSYIPLEKYGDAARALISATSTEKSTAHTPGSDNASETASKLILASDDPDVYTSAELSHASRAQSQLMLASKSTLDAAAGTKAGHKPVDDNVGWEGGFFKDVFWGLGQPGPPHLLRKRREEGNGTHNSTELALQLRELVGRSYLLDVAVLGQSDRVVCGVSSVACRLLAVMMGWEKAVVKGGWKNVDGQWDWKGIIW